MHLQENISLAELTTFKIGGPARFFVVARSIEDLANAGKYSDEKSLPIFVLGEGSNVLISDEGHSGLTVKIELKGIRFIKNKNYYLVEAASGESWDTLVKKTVERNLFGIENLSYIPGTVGAAPIQNIGAYGTEIKDTIFWVEVFDLKSKKIIRLNNKDCLFSYRDSIFKSKKGKNLIVTKICLKLYQKGSTNLKYKDLADFFCDRKDPSLGEIRQAVKGIRSKKFPNLETYGTAGSFFKNPIITRKKAESLLKKYPGLPIYPVNKKMNKISLAWVLDNVCNVKLVKENNVGVYKNQALVVVNYGGAKQKDVKNFSENIYKKIKKEINIKIENEVTFI